MAKSRIAISFLAGLFSLGLYKRNQGKQVRQVCGVSVAAIFIIAASALSGTFSTKASQLFAFGLPVLVGVLGCWLSYRIVNFPPVADFMISVQSEMNKVSWPTWPQLWRATVVVLVTMVFLAISLFVFDVIWRAVFTQIGFLRM